MSHRKITLTGAVTSALILATGLAGCGKVGQLEPASPMFGHRAATVPAPRPQDPTRPVETVDPRDRASDGLPPPPGAPPTPQ